MQDEEDTKQQKAWKAGLRFLRSHRQNFRNLPAIEKALRGIELWDRVTVFRGSNEEVLENVAAYDSREYSVHKEYHLRNLLEFAQWLSWIEKVGKEGLVKLNAGEVAKHRDMYVIAVYLRHVLLAHLHCIG